MFSEWCLLSAGVLCHAVKYAGTDILKEHGIFIFILNPNSSFPQICTIIPPSTDSSVQ
jgi:hypothetical protein